MSRQGPARARAGDGRAAPEPRPSPSTQTRDTSGGLTLIPFTLKGEKKKKKKNNPTARFPPGAWEI